MTVYLYILIHMYTYHYQQAGHNVIHFHNHCKHLGPGLSLVHPYCCSVYSILIYFIRISLCDLYLSCVFHSYCCCCYNTWISLRGLKKVYLIVLSSRQEETRRGAPHSPEGDAQCRSGPAGTAPAAGLSGLLHLHLCI